MAGNGWPWLAIAGHGKPGHPWLALAVTKGWVVESYLADVRELPDLGLKRPDPGPGRIKPAKNIKKNSKNKTTIKTGFGSLRPIMADQEW